MLPVILLSLLAYLIGAVPFGLLLAKTKGVDIRTQGSGNIGATNVLRTFGKPLGITCFLLDVLKGYLPAAFFPSIGTGMAGFPENVPDIGILFGACAILGHNFPVYLKFKGGKGVATSAGVLLGVAPFAVLIGILSWLAVFLSTRYVSLGSIIASAAVIITAWAAGYSTVTAAALTLLSLLTIWRHRENIHRLLEGEENKFERKKKA